MSPSDKQFEVFTSSIDIDHDRNPAYEELLNNAKALSIELQVPYEIYAPTFSLLDRLRDFDERTAYESLQTLPLAITAADVLLDFYPNPQVNKHYVWAAALLHDIGKTKLPQSLIEKSNLGQEWTEEDRSIMRQHPTDGALIAYSSGLPTEVCRAISEHHNKQYGCPNYGEIRELSDLERTTRDCVAVADFTDAAINRTNTRNANMSHEERLEEVSKNMEFVFDDYYNGDMLARSVFVKLAT